MTKRCEMCSGEGEIEVCEICAEEVGNCTCDGDSIPPIGHATCPDCNGDREVDEDDDEDESA